ncbi:hypothetical protein [Fibrella aquatica]|uniref:hypothetical protein n=1 Tax=Fibrella aquatica TaxID=3242487 RepID=UPI003521FE7A
MKKSVYPYALVVAIALFTTACSRDEGGSVTPTDALEHKHLRLLVSDENQKSISVVTPRTGDVLTQEAAFAKSAVYTTASGRFGVLIHRENNLVQKFDTGLEAHGDHVDVKGTPKWAAITGTGKAPTHFKTSANEVIIFNDGDGTLDVAQEGDFHKTGVGMTRINAGNVAHHGAMTKFSNGLYAITHKDGSIAGTLPERVKVIDGTGKVVYNSTVQTKGIHGNASNGEVALFGSASGVLLVDKVGKQSLIAHPASFSAASAWFGTILESGNSFIGFTAAMGAYKIDVASGQITPVLESNDIMQCKVDYAGNRLLILLHSGEVQIFDTNANRLLTKGTILPATDRTDTQKPQLEGSTRYLYVTQPRTGELLQIETANLANVKRIKVSATPYRLTIMGVESSEDH